MYCASGMVAPVLWAGRAGHLRMRRPSDRYANLYGLPTPIGVEVAVQLLSEEYCHARTLVIFHFPGHAPA